MKFATALLSMLAAPTTQSSVRALVRLVAVFVAAVVLFSVGFHALMDLEGRQFSWWTSVYWTIVTMSTLGFGDITFESDLGRMYSVMVLLVGSLIILILLPFTFIQFVYVPWREAVRHARTPRSLSDNVSGHMILTGLDPVAEVLIHRARSAEVPYVVLVDDAERAVALSDHGYEVMVGPLDDPATYVAARASVAALVVTARSDQANTNVAFTIREVTDRGMVIATANSPDAVDVLQLAGADRVIQLGELLGGAFARRILAPKGRSNVVDRFEDLAIAEAAASHTTLIGRTLAELDLRQRVGVSVVGVWDRGRFQPATPSLRIADTSILVLAGTDEQLAAYDDLYLDAPEGLQADRDGVVIIGGGRVGRAAARHLQDAGTRCTIVEKLPERQQPEFEYVLGDAADLAVLREAGIDRASAVIVTTHDDDTNIYLTLYCRRLRPDVEILGRVALDRNVVTLHRAGADFVLSYASTGATEIWNELRSDSTLLIAEGLLVFRVDVPPSLAGRRLRDTDIPAETGCRVIGVVQDRRCTTQFDPAAPLPVDAELILIGDDEAEDRFLRRYVTTPPNGWRRWRSRLRRDVAADG